MDPWINSLVQSPLVRSLNTVPSRMSSFAYGVRDNVPPFSFVKEVVDRKGGEALAWTDADPAGLTFAGETQTGFEFDIPESGLLDRMYLRVRMYSKSGARVPLDSIGAAQAVVGIDPADYYVKGTRDAYGSSMNFASILNSVVLRTTGAKAIQTLYPNAIASEVQKLPSAQREFWYQCLNGFAAGVADTAAAAPGKTPPFTQLYNPYGEIAAANGILLAAVNKQNQWADFLIPLPFDVLHQLKDNFQTRFVDDLSVAVSFNVDAALTAGPGADNPGFKCSLVCLYHNFHDVIENSIRDQNFKRGFPASVYSHNYVIERATSQSGKVLTYRFANTNLISEIICSLRTRADPVASRHSTALPPRDGTIGPFKFTLLGSGRQLWQAYSWELSGPDTADYQLADAHAYGEDLSRPVICRRVQNTMRNVAYASNQLIADQITLGFEQLYCLRFGFQAHDTFYTGGLALQTISNPTLLIESLGTLDTPWADPQAGQIRYSMDVTLKTCMMLRIDSDTGVITTSLDV